MEKLTKKDKERSDAIMHAIEIASNFQLYSYHVVSPEQFVNRTKELIQFFHQSKKSSENGQEVDPMQTSILD